MTYGEVILEREAAEAERVFNWRREELERAGYGRDAAEELADRSDVDLHLAVRLLRDGCPPPMAVRILS
ncbi:MAG: hypothetical protein ICV74_09740 [Thermoleophilia bacterium]|nr:hypothetical protein [Thermoleophilia bacterium]